jgi:hypothetical protein
MWRRWQEQATRYWQQRERDEETEKAMRLLKENLDTEQLREFEEKRHFHVHTKDGVRRYRIDWGIAGNVKLVEENGQPVPRVKHYCIHPSGSWPTPDVMLSQKHMIEAEEEEFLRIANVS